MSGQTFKDEIDDRKKELIDTLESITLEEMETSGLSLNLGGKTFRFSEVEVIEDENLEEKIRTEFRAKLNSQQQRIREKINTKINQLLTIHQQKQNEFDRKERSLQAKYNNAAMMPDITYDHAKKGLMVVKGSDNNHDELHWLLRGRYQVKFFLKSRAKKAKAIKRDLRARLIKDIIVKVKTKGSSIIGVSTHSPNATMSSFPHYHQMTHGDCWGSWKHPSSWSSPDDIIRCAKDALAVLETINEGSVAKDNPAGLPRVETVKNGLTTTNIDFEDAVKGEIKVEEEDVWST
jgi:hypothetical protein